MKNSKEKETCLHRATRLQNLELGWFSNQSDHGKFFSANQKALIENLELVKLLLSYKANRKLKDKHGLRPIDIAKRLYRHG